MDIVCYLTSRSDSGPVSFNDETSECLAGGAFRVRVSSGEDEVPEYKNMDFLGIYRWKLFQN